MSDDIKDGGNENSLTLVRTLKEVQIADAIGGLRDVKETRRKLGEFSVRDMHEAIYGGDFTKLVLGEHGGENTKMRDVAVDFKGTPDGQLRTRVTSQEQLTHNPASAEEIDRVLKARETELHESIRVEDYEAHATRPDAVDRYEYRMEGTEPPVTDFDISSLTPEEVAALNRLLAKAKR